MKFIKESVINKIPLFLAISVFLFLSYPFFFKAGVVQDEGYYLPKCWVSMIQGKRVLFSDYDCEIGETTATVRKMFFITSISQDLPPQYIIKIFGLSIPVHGWTHTGPIPYVIQNIFIQIGDKIKLGGIPDEDIRFIFSKIPSLIFGLTSLVFLYLVSNQIGVSPSAPLLFSSTLLIMVYNSSIGISVVYMCAICFSVMAMYFFLRERFSLFTLFSSLQIISYLPTFTFTISVVIGFLKYAKKKKKKVLTHLFLSLALGAGIYILSSIDVETNPSTPPPWLGITSRSPIRWSSFVNKSISENMEEKITLFLKDIVRFFGYKGSGNSFIIVEDYKSSIIFSAPFFIMLLICVIKTTRIKRKGVKKGDANELYKPIQEIKSSEEKFKGVILSLFIFFILQLLLFPFPNHPRRFFYAIGLISLIPAIAFKIQNSPKSEKESVRKKIILFSKKLIILTLFSSHIVGQIYLFKKAVDELEEKGRFHISTNYKYQFELAKYIREIGENSFVNVSGFINFPIMFGKSSQIPDYIYLLSTYYFYARDDFVKMIKRVIQIHSGKKFILQRGEEELETLRKVGELIEMKMEVVKKIPEDKPVYYIVEFHKVKTENDREKE